MPSSSPANDGGPTEILPDPVPHFIIFHLPHFWGTIAAYLLEYMQVEQFLASNVVTHSGHRYALMGIGFVVLANVASYLTGCVACARLEYNVKLPNLYADKSTNKHATIFNCIQRGHQNFMENLPQIVRN